jgi:hypothetical protein
VLLTTTNKDFKVKHGLSVSGGAIFGQAIEIGEPTADNHAATRGYTDQQVVATASPNSVQVATTTNINISTDTLVGDIIDGITLQADTRILIKNQTAARENGIYVVNASGPATRSPDYNILENMKPGKLVAVLDGTVNARTFWSFFDFSLVVDTDPIIFYNLSELLTSSELQNLAGFGINFFDSDGLRTISVDSNELIVSEENSGGATIDSTVTNSYLTSVGTLDSLGVSGATALADSLSVVGEATFDSNATIDGNLNVNGTLAKIVQNLEVDGSADFAGTTTFLGAVNVLSPTQSSNPATKDYVDNLLDQSSVEITTIDDLSNYFNGYNSRFIPTYKGLPVTLQNEFNLLLTIDGIIQSVGSPDYVWQSVMPRVGFRIDNDGYIAFPEPIPVGSSFDARVLVGSATTTQTKVYPFKAMDIVLGGY